jgi:hypothetical protein
MTLSPLLKKKDSLKNKTGLQKRQIDAVKTLLYPHHTRKEIKFMMMGLEGL